MNFSVEAEGIDFILRFRDEATQQINTAERSYSKLVSTMKSLITENRAFTDSVIESMTTASAAFRSNPSMFATPLTITPDQINLIGQFEGRAVKWFQQMSRYMLEYVNQMLGYVNRVRRATTETRAFSNSLAGVISQMRNMNKSANLMDGFFRQFKGTGGELRGLATLPDAINRLIKVIEQFIKVSPAFQKAATLNQESAERFSSTVDNLQKNAQRANFALRDDADATKKFRKELEDSTPKAQQLMGILSKMADLKYVVGGVLGSILMGQGARSFSTLEDVAYGLSTKLGLTRTQMDNMITDVRKVSLATGLSATDIAESTSIAAEKLGKLDQSVVDLAAHTVEWSRITGTSSAAAADAIADIGKRYDMTTESLTNLLKMAAFARQGSRGLQGPEFLQTLQDSDTMRRLAKNTGYGDDAGAMIQQQAAGLMATQRMMSQISNQSGQLMQNMLQGLTALNSKEAMGLKVAINGIGESYDDLVKKFKDQGAATAFSDVFRGITKMLDDSSRDSGKLTMMQEQFQQSLGLTAAELNNIQDAVHHGRLDQLQSITKELQDRQKMSQSWSSMVENYKGTVSGMLEKLNSLFQYVLTDIIPFLEKKVLPTINRIVEGFKNWNEATGGLLSKLGSIAVLAFSIGTALRGLRMFSDVAGISGIMKMIAKLFGIGGAGKSAVETAGEIAVKTSNTANTVATTANTEALIANTTASRIIAPTGFAGKGVQTIETAAGEMATGAAAAEAAAGSMAAGATTMSTAIGALSALAIPLTSILVGTTLAWRDLSKYMDAKKQQMHLTDKDVAGKLADDVNKISSMSKQQLLDYEKSKMGILRKGAQIGAFTNDQVDAVQSAINERKKSLNEIPDMGLPKFPSSGIHIEGWTPKTATQPITAMNQNSTTTPITNALPEIDTSNIKASDPNLGAELEKKQQDLLNQYGGPTIQKSVPQVIPLTEPKPPAQNDEVQKDMAEAMQKMASSDGKDNPETVAILKRIAMLLEIANNKKTQTGPSPFRNSELAYGNQ